MPKTRSFRDMTQAVSSTDDLLINVQSLLPGEYAISLFHDLDGDTEMDRNFIGFPKAPFGFSAPRGQFGPPKFEEAVIKFSGEKTTVEVELN